MKLIGSIVLTIALFIYGVTAFVMTVHYNQQCSGHLKRAADANTVEIAEKELQDAIVYLNTEGLTTGYTSIIYRTPDEDIGFFYGNLTASLKELESLPATATPLERSNMLMKLRETLVDHKQSGDSVTEPDGIQYHPNNLGMALWGWLTFIGAALFWTAFFND